MKPEARSVQCSDLGFRRRRRGELHVRRRRVTVEKHAEIASRRAREVASLTPPFHMCVQTSKTAAEDNALGNATRLRCVVPLCGAAPASAVAPHPPNILRSLGHLKGGRGKPGMEVRLLV